MRDERTATPVPAKSTWDVSGKTVTLYPAMGENRPLVLFHAHSGDGASLVRALEKAGAPDVNLLVIGNLDWNHDMTPWACPPLSPDAPPITGGADGYLALLRGEILPRARKVVRGKPVRTCIAGYSLAGLFALYALYRCSDFDRAASMSGSLWFPGWLDFVMEHDMHRSPDQLYFSLGDREAKTRNPLLKTVGSNTERIAAHYRAKGIPVKLEIHPGGHFRDIDLRSAKGIASIC